MDLSEFTKAFEAATLSNQFLYSAALDHPLTDADFEHLKKEDVKEQIVADVWKKIILNLDHEEQIAFLKWGLDNQDFSKTTFDRFAGMDDKVKRIMTVADSDQEAQSLVLEALSHTTNKALEDFAGVLDKLPAAIIKKLLVNFLKGGIDFKGYAEANEAAQKEALIKEIMNLPPGIRDVVAAKNGIDPSDLPEVDEDEESEEY